MVWSLSILSSKYLLRKLWSTRHFLEMRGILAYIFLELPVTGLGSKLLMFSAITVILKELRCLPLLEFKTQMSSTFPNSCSSRSFPLLWRRNLKVKRGYKNVSPSQSLCLGIFRSLGGDFFQEFPKFLRFSLSTSQSRAFSLSSKAAFVNSDPR